MINIFQQKIGIYYKNRDFAEETLKYFLSALPQESIKLIKKTNNELMAVLVDGTTIRCIKANNTARGAKFDKIFIEEGIEYNIYRQIILPQYSCRYYYNPCIIRENKDIINADYYYKETIFQDEEKKIKCANYYNCKENLENIEEELKFPVFDKYI